MNRNYILLSLLTLIFAGGTVSCQRELPQDPETNLMLQINLPQEEQAKSEAGDDALNENRIATLDLFVYKTGDDACAHYQRIPVNPSLGMTRYGISKAKSGFEANAAYTLYVVANGGTATDGTRTLPQLKQAVAANALTPDAKQETFLMDGKSASTVLNNGTPDNESIAVTLKRAVAKIRMNLTYGPAYTPAGTVTKKLVNYATTAAVIEEGNAVTPTLSTTGFTEVGTVSEQDDQVIVYSYANDWNSSVGNETCISLCVPVDNGSTVENHYYKIPVNYRLTGDGSDPAHLYKILRNYIYQITVLVNKAGSSNPEEPVLLESVDYQIRNWETRQVETWIKNIQYLFVQDPQIEMTNIAEIHTLFQSSTPDVTIDDIEVLVEGNPVDRHALGVTVEAQPGVQNGRITIYSPIPTNYVPRVINFNVKNGCGLVEPVTITQYPPLWIGHVTSETVSSNRNMYTINVKLADLTKLPPPDVGNRGYWEAPFIRQYYHDLTGKLYTGPNPWQHNDGRTEQPNSNFRIGYPAIDKNGNTDPAGDNRWMISPNFMFASRASSTTLYYQWSALGRCKNYTEKDVDGNVYTGWRLPTYAEMVLIDVLQNIQAAEIRNITDRHRYWVSDPWHNAAFRILNPAGSPNNENAERAEVRCVRDIGRQL